MKTTFTSREIEGLFSLQGRNALVTGSSRGLGLVIARGLAGAGARVVLNGRDETRLKEVGEELESEGLQVRTCAFDVTDERSVSDAVADLEEHMGPIHILVNNAGMQHRAYLHELERVDWDSVMAVNLSAPFLVAKHCARRMIARKYGKIINICSLMSELGRNTVGPYAAAKGGLKMLTRAMTVDWARHNIQVNAIGPGYFVTEMTRPLADDPDFDTWLRARTPAGRWGDPRELVGAAVFLSSDAAGFVNGQILYVDGGILAAL